MEDSFSSSSSSSSSNSIPSYSLCFFTISTRSEIVLTRSASCSAIVISNFSSIAMTISTESRESIPRSFWSFVSPLISSMSISMLTVFSIILIISFFNFMNNSPYVILNTIVHCFVEMSY
ncbi:MAG: hypothetical protein [Caudoviricetes sp.]|nr:MAG: hypothetical protein [Caudoviricetes sp.]